MRAIKEKYVQGLSESLVSPLAAVVKTSEDNFTFEWINTRFFYRGQEDKSYPFVEVFWFERPQSVQDECARLITAQIKAFGEYEDVVVVFRVLSKVAYYENGEHF